MSEKNIIKVYTTSTGAELYISAPSTKQIINATNNRAQYFAEQSKKYRDEAKQHCDNAKFYSEQNSDVTYEYINQVKSNLEEKIQEKQPVGNYAFVEDLPQNVSELNNDAEYINKTELEDAITSVELPDREDKSGCFLMTNGINEAWMGINSFQLFDIKIADHVLSYEESKGLALQGTYVYKEALAGTRYGYPDFYAKCLEEYNEATNIETVNGVTLKVHTNGHKFYDIANKASIDSFFNAMGTAWFYGVDTVNECIFLPRNNYFEQMTVETSEVGQSVEAGLPNITGFGADNCGSILDDAYDGAMYRTTTATSKTRANYNGTATSTNTTAIDASRSSTVYGNSSTVQPNAVKKLLYICVGNTTNYKNMTDIVNQGMEILEQVNQSIETRVKLDGTNFNIEGKSLISSLGMPSNKYIDLTLGASGTSYIAPANGWIFLRKATNSSNQYAELINDNNSMGTITTRPSSGSTCSVYIPCKKGEKVLVYYSAGGETKYFRFVYAEGEV